MNRKVLIITYYWPPSGGSGVQRWLKFVKYLPQFGWSPYVFTPENPSFAIKDESLLKDIPNEAEVIHFPIWEPYEAFFKLSRIFSSGDKGDVRKAKPTDLVSVHKQSLFQKISTWIRANIFIPDPRIFWIKPSVKFLDDFIRENKIRNIVTTGPPHSMHLIGYQLKRKNPSLNWLTDFRDPWSEWGLLDSLNVSSFARDRHRRLEQLVLTTANKIITITPFFVRRFEQLSNRKVQLLTNGYDQDDFYQLAPVKIDTFVIRHVGIVNEKCDPRSLIVALRDVVNENPKLRSKVRLDFVGEVHPDFKSFVNSHAELSGLVSFSPSVPHKRLITLYNESALLLLVLAGYKDAEGYMPGKLFEYIATGLPILGVGPANGDAAALMKKTGRGEMIDDKQISQIKQALFNHFQQWLSADTLPLKAAAAEEYSRKAITAKLIELLE